MRQILIDWMVDVHDSFELKEQTLHLALSYLADYSALKEISKEDYQLAGIACLWLASKYEEIYPPRTRNYIEVTADTYSVRDLKNMEGNIIEALGFEIAECFKDMCLFMQNSNKYDLTAIRRKYGKNRNYQVSKIKFTMTE